MKILFQNRDPKSWIGGDQIQLDKTREALERIGINTAFSSDYVPDPQDIVDADVVHCFNFSMPWSKYQIWNAKKLKKKVVCSMIYHETEEFVSYKFQQAMINDLDYCLFLTQGEIDRARRHLVIPEGKIKLIPNGIDENWFYPPTVSYETDVLTVGRVDENKGQLEVALACKNLGLKYTVIGECSPYAIQVMQAGADVKDPMTHEELKKWYAGCKVYALVSYKEVMPLTVMEAGSQGKPIVMTAGCEWDIPVQRAEFKNVVSIERALIKAIAQKENPEFRDQLKEMTWGKVAEQLKNIYNG